MIMKDTPESKPIKFDTILVLDFGGQYCHLIAKRIRGQRVFSEIVSCDITADAIIRLKEQFDVKGLILSGGPSSVYEDDAPRLDPKILDLGIPILGLCYGHQLLVHLFNGRVKRGHKREYGSASVLVEKPVGVLENLKREEMVWMSHYDTVDTLPNTFEVLAHTDNCPIAAVRHKWRPIYGIQWHPEVAHTEHGSIILRNFIFNICGCSASWSPSSLIDEAVEEIKRTVNGKRAIIGLSGGIDSTTATILSSKAIGKNLTAVFVDHGFMREGEPDYVAKTFAKFDVNIMVIDAQKRFFTKLEGVVDPEEKRRIIGEEFIRVFEEVAKKTEAEYLIQGTIYPDRIESGARKGSEKIKSHHNVAGIPSNIRFTAIIEPLRDLYKDEMREIAKSLGVPYALINRQPFPGPGLAVRIIGEAFPESADLLRKADKIVTEEIENHQDFEVDLWQYFAVLTNIRSTGVKGDTRAYGSVLAIRAVESREAMTARFARIPYKVLERMSTRITNELPQITRVVYDITHKPPSTIEWE
jgi:GMP synthase (glutamine-hydrolysing)